MDEQQNDVMTDEQVLAYTQHKRKFIVSKLIANNQLPGDKDEKVMLLQALDGMDRAALGNKRIKADEKTANGMAGAAGIIAQMLTQIGTLTRDNISPLEILERVEAPSLSNEIPEPILVPGELETNASQLDYDSFMSRAGN